MNIIIEGPDGSGKTTLAKTLLEYVPWSYVEPAGPPKSPGEMISRTMRYFRYKHKIIDRHPCISEPIYGAIRKQGSYMLPQLIDEFYAQDNLIIYCYGQAGLHVIKDRETAEHVTLIERHDEAIRHMYDEWGRQHATVMHSARNGDLNAIIQLCEEYSNET